MCPYFWYSKHAYNPHFRKEGPTQHRPMAHPVVFYIFNRPGVAGAVLHTASFLLHNPCRKCHSSPTVVPGLWPGWDRFVLVCSMKWLASDLRTGWPHVHGPTNVKAMEKIYLYNADIFAKLDLWQVVATLGVGRGTMGNDRLEIKRLTILTLLLLVQLGWKFAKGANLPRR